MEPRLFRIIHRSCIKPVRDAKERRQLARIVKYVNDECDSTMKLSNWLGDSTANNVARFLQILNKRKLPLPLVNAIYDCGCGLYWTSSLAPYIYPRLYFRNRNQSYQFHIGMKSLEGDLVEYDKIEEIVDIVAPYIRKISSPKSIVKTKDLF